MIKSPPKIINDVKPRIVVVSKKSKSKNLKDKKITLVTALLFLIFILAAASIIYSIRNNHLKSSANGISKLRIVEAEVAKHYLLPLNEVPALATVTNSSKLTTPFFKNAKNGDEILIYENNKIAIIYRPSIDRIVAVGPVSITTTTGSK